MINEDNQTEIIELYLQGELEGELLEEFEKRMQEDADFREQVTLEKEVLEGLDALALDALQKDLDEIHKNENVPDNEYAGMRQRFEQIHVEVGTGSGGKSVNFQPHQKAYWGIAAVLALLIVSGITIFIIYQSAHPPVMAYVQVREVDQDGNLARGGKTDTLQVMINPPSGEYIYHYQLSDHLQLYGDFKPDDLQIFYSPKIDQYFLEVGGQRYLLQRNDNIVGLEKGE